MTNLTDGLDLSGNQFSGSIPPELNNLANLTRLVLSYNQLKGTIPDLSGLTKLKEIALEGNELTGTVSAGTCAAISAAVSSADCNPNGGGEVECSCCTRCCLTTENNACQSAR
jgi:hypothetical protein